MVPAAEQRVVAMVQVAIFHAINWIDRRYRPYVVQLQAAPTTSKRRSWQRCPQAPIRTLPEPMAVNVFVLPLP
jgi:hypothetical protein